MGKRFRQLRRGGLFRFEGERVVYERTGPDACRPVGDFLGHPHNSPLNFFSDPLAEERPRDGDPEVIEVDDPRREVNHG